MSMHSYCLSHFKQQINILQLIFTGHLKCTKKVCTLTKQIPYLVTFSLLDYHPCYHVYYHNNVCHSTLKGKCR